MSRKKITTAKKEATVAKNKQRLDNLLNLKKVIHEYILYYNNDRIVSRLKPVLPLTANPFMTPDDSCVIICEGF